jgi:hypothetical protein
VKWLIITLYAIGLISCSGFGTQQESVSDEVRQEARAQVPCIVALPVIADVQSDDSMTYDQAAELEKGAAYMDQQLSEALKGRDNIRFLSHRQLMSLLPIDEVARAAMLSKIGSELKCNAVLETTLSRYVQRVGGEFGADSPASATFSMKLYNTSDASVIWVTTFRETQQSLLSNIMSAYKYGLKWLTVEELVTMGIDEKVKQCPYF